MTTTSYSAGDMADAAAQGYRDGQKVAWDMVDKLASALRGMFNEYGELEYDIAALDQARAAIAEVDAL